MVAKFKLLAVLVLISTGCINAPPFICSKDEQCNSKPPGICVQSASHNAYCAVPAEGCSSGYRYHNSAALDLVNKCAPLPLFELIPQTTLLEENQSFTMHAVLKDGDGTVMTTYKGEPEISTNWNDLLVVSKSNFLGGEADFTFKFNRETNGMDGPAFVYLKDGHASGSTPGITVTSPPWQSLSTASTVVNTVLYKPDTYTAWVGRADGIYRGIIETKDIFTAWPIAEKPVLAAKDTPFGDSMSSGFVIQQISPKVAFDGANYLMLYTALLSRPGTSQRASGTAGAESNDGVVWRNRPFVVQSTDGAENCSEISGPAGLISESEGNYRLFFSGKEGYCTAVSSNSGATWSPTPLQVSGANSVSFKHVIKTGSVYRGIGSHYLTSSDGVHWVASSVLPPEFMTTFVWNPKEEKFYGFVDGETVKIFTRK